MLSLHGKVPKRVVSTGGLAPAVTTTRALTGPDQSKRHGHPSYQHLVRPNKVPLFSEHFMVEDPFQSMVLW